MASKTNRDLPPTSLIFRKSKLSEFKMPGLLGRRAVWKGPFFKAYNLPKLNANQAAAAEQPASGTVSSSGPNRNRKSSQQTAAPVDTVQLRTECRNCTILPSFVGQKFHVHNGKDYVPVLVNEDMIGHRLGEFAFTKKVRGVLYFIERILTCLNHSRWPCLLPKSLDRINRKS